MPVSPGVSRGLTSQYTCADNGRMKVIDVIHHPMFGTQQALADAIGAQQSSISEWMKKGCRLPSHHQITIETLTGIRADAEAVKRFPHVVAAIRKGKRRTRAKAAA